MSARDRMDLAYGRQGGRVVAGAPSTGRKARACEACGLPMLVQARGATRHGVCDPETLEGLVCSCPPGCTDLRVGDLGGCDPGCQVCARHAGRLWKELFKGVAGGPVG